MKQAISVCAMPPNPEERKSFIQSRLYTIVVLGNCPARFQKDLGAGTTEAAKAITTYDPDRTWEPTR